MNELRPKLIPLLFWLLVAISAFLPETLWGVHFIAFLSTPFKLALLLFGLLIIVYPFGRHAISVHSSKTASLSIVKAYSIIVLAALGYALILYNFPIVVDEYGDAYRYQTQLQNTIKELPKGFIRDLFAFEVAPSSGRRFVLFFIGFLSYKFQLPYSVLFKWIGIVSGVGFCLSWLSFLRHYMSNIRWQIAFGLTGLFAPFTQMFYNHVESYPLVFLFFFSWLLLLFTLFKKKRPILTGGLLLCWLFLQRLHPMAWMLLPVWLLALLHQLNLNRGNDKWSLKQASIVVSGLACTVGLFVYFFVLGDYRDERFLEGVTDVERLFLPIVSPPEPLDRYNLFSWNHLFDFFNSILHWSVPAISTLLVVGLGFRKRINWKTPELIALLTTLFLMCVLLFMINPLNSMPMDWDLFSFPALILLLLAVTIIKQVENDPATTSFVPSVVGLLMITMPFVFVNANASGLSKRLGALGIHVFKTYYIHSNRIIISAASQQPTDEEYLDFKAKVEDQLEPWAIPRKDSRFANLLMDDGYLILTRMGDYERAEIILEKAASYDSSSAVIRSLLDDIKLFTDVTDEVPIDQRYQRIKGHGIKLLRESNDLNRALTYLKSAQMAFPDSMVFTLYKIEARFRSQDYLGAYYDALPLVDARFPTEKKSLRVAIHCALEARLFAEALKHSEQYLLLFPDDELIIEVRDRLKASDRPHELRLLFQSR